MALKSPPRNERTPRPHNREQTRPTNNQRSLEPKPKDTATNSEGGSVRQVAQPKAAPAGFGTKLRKLALGQVLDGWAAGQHMP